jgi:serine/threonine protein kinase
MFQCPTCGSKRIEEGKPCPVCRTNIDSFRDSSTVVQSLDTPFAGFTVTANTLPQGSMFANRFRIEELVGRGGMGSVYRVFDTQDQEDRALKILHAGFQGDDGSDRFRREIEILSKIDHPAVPKIFDWGSEGSQLYFVAEFIDGRDLKTEMAKREEAWPPEEAAKLGAAIAEALAEAHKMKVVHRDVKPQNIIIADDGSVRLLDFGVARAQGQGMQTLTKTGMILGTPEYMSPEQFGSHKVEAPSDVYSLGVVLYELVTGQLPFSGHPMDIALKIVTEPVPPPRTINRDVPAWLDRIILKCLQKDLKKRYMSALELAADLKHVRETGRPKMEWLPGGDAIVHDLAGTAECDLVLSSSKEKDNWEEGVGLHFGDMLYRLDEIIPPDEKMKRWFYCFSYWPPEQVARQVIDYETDRLQRSKES